MPKPIPRSKASAAMAGHPRTVLRWAEIPCTGTEESEFIKRMPREVAARREPTTLIQ